MKNINKINLFILISFILSVSKSNGHNAPAAEAPPAVSNGHNAPAAEAPPAVSNGHNAPAAEAPLLTPDEGGGDAALEKEEKFDIAIKVFNPDGSFRFEVVKQTE